MLELRGVSKGKHKVVCLFYIIHLVSNHTLRRDNLPKDTYSKWEDEGTLEKRIETIKELVAKKIPQKKIAEVLGISERVIIKLKKEHASIRNAFIYGNKELKDSLVNAIYERAVGVKKEEITTIIEETPRGQKKRVSKTIKHYPPDPSAAKYLLIINFGREFNDRKEEIELMEKRVDNKEEIWK